MVDDQSLPVLDSAALKVLEDEAGEAVTRGFIEEYLLMLPTRAARILKGLAGEDPEPGGQALMSLRVTSAMAGVLCALKVFAMIWSGRLKADKVPSTVELALRI